MTKLEIVNVLYEKLGFSKRECAHIVDTFFEAIKYFVEGRERKALRVW